MAAAVFSGGSIAFGAVLCGILGFYLLTHPRFSLKEFFSIGGKR
jgi:hypothetical protein